MTHALGRVSRVGTEIKSRCVFHYRPSKDPLRALTGQVGVFTRPSTATGYTKNGRIYTASQNMPRIVQSGDEPALLLELQGTNKLLHSQDMSNAIWVKEDVTIAAAPLYTSPLGAAPYRMAEGTGIGVSHYMHQTFSHGANDAHAASVLVRAAGRTKGYFYLNNPNGNVGMTFDLSTGAITAYQAGAGVCNDLWMDELEDGWFRLYWQGKPDTVLTSSALILLISDNTFSNVYTGDGASGFFTTGFQIESGSLVQIPTSYVATTASTATRAADTMYFPLAITPQQPTTFYLKWRERGGWLAGGYRLLQLSNSAGDTPFFLIYYPGDGTVQGHFSDGVNAVHVSLDAFVNRIGDVVEFSVRLGRDDTTDETYGVWVQKSVNGGAIASGSFSLTYQYLYPFPAAYSDARLYLNSAGNALQSAAEYYAVKVALGHHELETMRDMF